jgi:hypothetical protein
MIHIKACKFCLKYAAYLEAALQRVDSVRCFYLVVLKDVNFVDVDYWHGYKFWAVSLVGMYLTELRIRLSFRTLCTLWPNASLPALRVSYDHVGTSLYFMDTGPSRLRYDLSDSFYQTVRQLNYPPATLTSRSMWQEAWSPHGGPELRR